MVSWSLCKGLLCLSNRINMLKSDIYIYIYVAGSFHIYVQITIYMSKLQYINIYPDCNICIQMVIYMSKMSMDVSKCCVIFKQIDVYISRNFSAYIYFLVSTTCKCSWIDSRRLQTEWRPSGFQNVLNWSSILRWGS